ncbi:HEPN domain-containing protein [Longispora urticae]
MLFTFQEFGGMESIGRWLNVAESHRSMLTRVMYTRYKWMFTDDRFFSRVAALEALHKSTIRKRATFKERLMELANLVRDPFENMVGDVDYWTSAVREQRNKHAHHQISAVHHESKDLFALSESCYWLFVLSMFHFAEVPADAITKLASSADFQWASDLVLRMIRG